MPRSRPGIHRLICPHIERTFPEALEAFRDASERSANASLICPHIKQAFPEAFQTFRESMKAFFEGFVDIPAYRRNLRRSFR
jgi:hypothetical protein